MIQRQKRRSQRGGRKVDSEAGSVEPKEHSEAGDSLGEHPVDRTGTKEIEGTSTGAESSVKPISSQNTKKM